MHESSHGGGGSDGIEPTGAPTAADEEIMGKLPRSRPKRQSARREALRSRPATDTSKGRPAARPAHTGGAPGASEPAPGLPRLALDGAIEVAKMPAKVSANLTLRALDAVVKGLRRQ